MHLFFHRVYEMADRVATTIENRDNFLGELDWTSPELCRCLSRFSKTSLLGHYCFTVIRLCDLQAYRKDPEAFSEDHVKVTEAALGTHGIPFIPFQQFLSSPTFTHRETDDLDSTDTDIYALYPWVKAQEWETFVPLWEKMTDEVFHLLFSNRSVLLGFNSMLAEFRKNRGDTPSARCYVPHWVKSAVYFRERGKCALCRKDLSGLVALDARQHYDHIVPLKGLGANDPCNLQLLCTGCNLAKGGSLIRTSSIYEPWWE